MTSPLLEGQLSPLVQACVAAVKAHAPGFSPSVALILGSGLGGFADTLTDKLVLPYKELPHFPRSSVPGHAGRLVLGKCDGQDVMAIHPVMYMALSYDHRIVDGVAANGFLFRINELLEKSEFDV